MDKKDYRKIMGERLKKFRKDKGLTAYRVAKNGNIRIEQVKAVETGDTNYTIDIFVGYIVGCGLYMHLAEKEGTDDKEFPHDFKDFPDL